MEQQIKQTQFQELFHNHYEQMCRFAISYTKDEQSAEDVVQETFIKLWEQKQDLLGQENMRYYLVTAVRNNCISYLRKQPSLVEIEHINASEPDTTIGYLKRIEQETQDENLLRIKKALNLLPPKCKEVFLLVKMHGMSYKQCAETMGLSVKTIENQMTKAIKVFKHKQVVLLLTCLFISNLK